MRNYIFELYAEHPHKEALINAIGQHSTKIWLRGLTGAAKTLLPAQIVPHIPCCHVFILAGKEEANYYYSDLVTLTGNDKVLFFPSSYKRTLQAGVVENTNVVLRTEVLNRISSGENNLLIVTYTEALFEKTISKKKLTENTLFLKIGEKISLNFLNEVLQEYGFEQVDFVYYPGQYSIRGSIADVFSFSNDEPYRIDFFGDEVESIRKFDIETQLSTEKLEKVCIIPSTSNLVISNTQTKFSTELESLISFVPEQTVFWIENLTYSINILNEAYENTDMRFTENKLLKEHVCNTGNLILEDLKGTNVVEFGQNTFFKADKKFDFTITPH